MTTRAAIVDVDGTIVRSEELIPGAVEGLRAIEERGLSRLLFSNNPTRAGDHYVERLAAHGLEIDPADVLTSGTVTAAHLAEHHPGTAVYLVGEDRLERLLEEAGLRVTDDPERAGIVVGSIDRDLSYDTLAGAIPALERDLPFYGTDPDTTIPGSGGPVPGSGAILAAMAAVAGREPDAVLGKPSAIAAEAALETLGTDPAETVVVGDRLDTDVALGEAAGIQTALVLTGITDRDDLAESDVEPDYVLESLGEIERVLEE
ncbi:HAD-IIA family hydrolase [Saliphagus sp. LR7]|uniref:HAD-IIA family hydrolase n=1 Tax=Saliphagus sp. LR7 TaxID=2282654 RepID=UPI000DF83183|nr:HAD-IIA family hydrolase [Saliphagus sp. LR7]